MLIYFKSGHCEISISVRRLAADDNKQENFQPPLSLSH